MLDPFDDLSNPRLNDALRLDFTQEDVTFAIPRLTRDIPLAIDPFLLWKSPRADYQLLHQELLNYFQHLHALVRSGDEFGALTSLLRCQEPQELGLGYTKGGKKGTSIGRHLASEILSLYSNVPQIEDSGLSHIEIIGLVVPNIAEDRLGDMTASVLKGYLIEYTSEQAGNFGIPVRRFMLDDVLDRKSFKWQVLQCSLPFHPVTKQPLVFAPLDLLRHLPWINFGDYVSSPFAGAVLPADRRTRLTKPQVQARNRGSFGAVEAFVREREEGAERCSPDPLFRPLKESTLRVKLRRLQRLRTGREDGAAQDFEEIAFSVLATLMHPDLEFAEKQSRTAEGVHIRDMVFYNNGRSSFAHDLKNELGCVQVVFEFKNVAKLTGSHIDQLYRYMDEKAGFGRFGVLVTRNRPSTAMQRNIRDLYLAKGRVILILTDDDLIELLEWHLANRPALGLVQRRYVQFLRSLPA